MTLDDPTLANKFCSHFLIFCEFAAMSSHFATLFECVLCLSMYEYCGKMLNEGLGSLEKNG